MVKSEVNQRYLRVISQVGDGVNVQIKASGKITSYFIRRIPSQISRSAFQVIKGDGAYYCVRPDQYECDCGDRTFRDRPCKHIDAINAMISRGLI